jgi:hypothetical protein
MKKKAERGDLHPSAHELSLTKMVDDPKKKRRAVAVNEFVGIAFPSVSLDPHCTVAADPSLQLQLVYPKHAPNLMIHRAVLALYCCRFTNSVQPVPCLHPN